MLQVGWYRSVDHGSGRGSLWRLPPRTYNLSEPWGRLGEASFVPPLPPSLPLPPHSLSLIPPCDTRVGNWTNRPSNMSEPV